MNYLLTNATEILLLIFLIVTFLQSGIDKVFDWKGNLSWLREHFSDTPLKPFVSLLLATVLLFEVISGILCAIGIYQIVILHGYTIALYGAIFSCISLLMLLFGQRVAKDYEGAKTIAVYFVPAIFLTFLLQSHLG